MCSLRNRPPPPPPREPKTVSQTSNNTTPIPYFSNLSREKVQQAIDAGDAISLYIENLAEAWKPVDIHRILSKGVADVQRLLNAVNRVQVEKGALRANLSKDRMVHKQMKSRKPPASLGSDPRVSGAKSFVGTVRGSGPFNATPGQTEIDAVNTFVPTTETVQWLGRCAVGVLKNPTSMESVHYIWILDGMRNVEVTDMGGDKVLVCFPTKENMTHFLQCNHDWVRLRFDSLVPWCVGDRATNRACWLEVRGLPLMAWAQEFFEIVGSWFGKLIKVHPETVLRKHLGAARLEVLTSNGGVITKVLEVKVMGHTYKIDVTEVDIGNRCSVADASSDGEDMNSDDQSGKAKAGVDCQHNHRDGNHAPIPETEADPFNLMPTIAAKFQTGKSTARVGMDIGGNSCQGDVDPVRVEMGSSPKVSLVLIHNSFSPLNEIDDEPQYPPGFSPRPEQTTPVHHPGTPSSCSPSVSTTCSSNDSQYTKFLEDRLARAISMARVSTRKKFKRANPKGSTMTSQSPHKSASRWMHVSLPQEQVQVPASLVSLSQEQVLAPASLVELSQEQVQAPASLVEDNSLSQVEAQTTVALGDALGWDCSEDPTKEVRMARALVDKEQVEWSLSKADV
ncbi:hypothetical protein Tsubulata_044983 [Turnera subulata]|uniref:DUF4283 domain-containing protein n=1 Tax=Turnera subulata TaxID=218843 RepID=A0A9Q0G210_9ROSI|nr:hypothetical protein Tsubulata_044983 [Turnera subulata]